MMRPAARIVLAEIVIAALPPHRPGKHDVNFFSGGCADPTGGVGYHPIQSDADMICVDKTAGTKQFNMHKVLVAIYKQRMFRGCWR